MMINEEMMMKAKVAGQAGWWLRNSQTGLFVTECGGHMAPVTFGLDTGQPICPYYLSPWQEEGREDLPAPVLVPLRGDFFCLPFGGNAEEFEGERHTCHGEPATARWQWAGEEQHDGVVTLVLKMKTQVRPGRVEKRLSVVDGHAAVYGVHRLTGYAGAMPLGHHATLAVPAEAGGLRVTVGEFALGMTCPAPFSLPENGEYQALAVGCRFTDLRRVPTLWVEPAEADCTRYPGRRGFCDLLLVLKRPGLTPAWTVAYNRQENYLWFSLKDAGLLPGTALWMDNGGRHGAPWDGRNRCLGLEDICGHFADGLAASVRRNALNEEGFATAVALSADSPTEVRYVQGAIPVPAGFGEEVAEVVFGPGVVTFVSDCGCRVEAQVGWEFIAGGEGVLSGA